MVEEKIIHKLIILVLISILLGFAIGLFVDMEVVVKDCDKKTKIQQAMEMCGSGGVKSYEEVTTNAHPKVECFY